MEYHDVLTYLCWYDPRNPGYLHADEPEDERPKPRDNCACDNCFYGKDRLALEILDLRDRLRSALVGKP